MQIKLVKFNLLLLPGNCVRQPSGFLPAKQLSVLHPLVWKGCSKTLGDYRNASQNQPFPNHLLIGKSNLETLLN